MSQQQPETVDTDDVEFDDGPAPTLPERALAAQDRMGWATMPATRDGEHAHDFTSGALDLARVVVALAREVEALREQLAEQPVAFACGEDGCAFTTESPTEAQAHLAGHVTGRVRRPLWRRPVEAWRERRRVAGLPHDPDDPYCIKWWTDAHGYRMHARCPTCNPVSEGQS